MSGNILTNKTDSNSKVESTTSLPIEATHHIDTYLILYNAINENLNGKTIGDVSVILGL